jgi:alpha-N-arabinofuranosidase
MTNIAQMVNVLQAMIITDKDKMLLTPTYYAYQLYVPFQNATSMPVTIENNDAYQVGGASIPGISASAARAKDGKLYLALVNTHPQQPAEVVLNVAGQPASAASGRVLTAAAMDADNTFQHPRAVQPVPFSAKAEGGKLGLTLPAKAVLVVAIDG